MVINASGPEANDASAPATAGNKNLDGHKLLILTKEPPPAEKVERLKSLFSGLKIEHRAADWATKKLDDGWTDEDWKDVTILVSGNTFPADKEVAPKLQYVQLQSAGANMILKHPLFTDADVQFCTANGVHG
jgi:hypothetical protein